MALEIGLYGRETERAYNSNLEENKERRQRGLEGC